MANNSINIEESASPTKKLASQSLTRGVDTVHQEEIVIGDGSTDGRIAAITAANALKVDASGVNQPVTDAGGSLTVDALDLDIRNLATGQDKVDARLRDAADAGFIDPVIKAQLPAALVGGRLSVDASGVAVPVTDNAGSLTVDAPVGTPVFVRLSDGAANLIGQKAMASSVPVVLASDQTAIPVTTVIPGTAASNLGKAEDTGHADGDTGVFVLGVRTDVPNLPTAAPTSANTDYSRVASDTYGVAWVRTRQLVTYTGLYRLANAAAGTLSLTFTFTANTDKQLATIYHTGASTKTVKIRKISLFLATTAAGICDFEVRALSAATAPATGNPAITPRTHDPADGAAEATCLALPTTAGSLVGADTGTVSLGVSINVGAGAAQTTPALAGAEYMLYEYKDGSESKPLTMRAGIAEGFAVNGRCTTAVAQRFTIVITFTEE